MTKAKKFPMIKIFYLEFLKGFCVVGSWGAREAWKGGLWLNYHTPKAGPHRDSEPLATQVASELAYRAGRLQVPNQDSCSSRAQRSGSRSRQAPSHGVMIHHCLHQERPGGPRRLDWPRLSDVHSGPSVPLHKPLQRAVPRAACTAVLTPRPTPL